MNPNTNSTPKYKRKPRKTVHRCSKCNIHIQTGALLFENIMDDEPRVVYCKNCYSLPVIIREAK